VAWERTALGSGWAKDMAETRTALAAGNEVDMVSSQVSGHFPRNQALMTSLASLASRR
jgi:hypothetical protein